MRNIIDGHLHFKNFVYPQDRQLFHDLGTGQNPQALFITCADSRIVPNLITQTGPGDLFVCRTVGNQIPAHGAAEEIGVSSSIEYALEVLGVREVIVCGHSDCGAMKAVLHPQKVATLPSTQAWLKNAAAARSVVMHKYKGLPDPVLLEKLAEENVIAQIHNLCTHPSVAAKMSQGLLTIHGWLYQIHSGEITTYNPSKRSFDPLHCELVADGEVICS